LPTSDRLSQSSDDQQQHRDQKPRHSIADHENRTGPRIERLAIPHRLADAERDRDEIRDQRHPEAERDRDRHLFLDQLDHGHVAEVALAEIERQVILHHQQEALGRRLVEPELLFEALDEFGIQPLRAAILRGDAVTRPLAKLALIAAAERIAASAAQSLRSRNVAPRQLGDHLLDRTTRRELDDDEADQHDPEHGRDDEQHAFQEIGSHCSISSPYAASASIARREARFTDVTAL
jgi:hypothetical protein